MNSMSVAVKEALIYEIWLCPSFEVSACFPVGVLGSRDRHRVPYIVVQITG